ncbi:MAG: hypothetical protein CMK53_06430 [Proteobacteria bacterium]|nr:hypothetical protein [Pseudomonadota bacterium]
MQLHLIFLTLPIRLNVTRIKEWLKKKGQVKIEREKMYEQRWVWYHTLLAIELLIANIILIWIALLL